MLVTVTVTKRTEVNLQVKVTLSLRSKTPEWISTELPAACQVKVRGAVAVWTTEAVNVCTPSLRGSGERVRVSRKGSTVTDCVVTAVSMPSVTACENVSTPSAPDGV